VADDAAYGRRCPKAVIARCRGYKVSDGWIQLEFSTLYLTDRFTGKPPTEEPLYQWVPMVEFQFDTPLGGGYGTQTAATMNPGLAYVFPTYQPPFADKVFDQPFTASRRSLLIARCRRHPLYRAPTG